MARQIEATPEQLYADGRYVAGEALENSIHKIDELLGKGYAAKNPELLAAMVSASVSAGVSCNSQAIMQEELQSVGRSISEIASSLLFAGND